MGRLIDGRWTSDELKADGHGRFVREETKFRRVVTRDGSSGFEAVSGRYHLYVSLACPWAQRTLIMRRLKGLEAAISVSVAEPVMSPYGWSFNDSFPDAENGTTFLKDVYLLAEPRYTGRVTVPVLWDRRERTIVSNESREILRMLDTEFEDCAREPGSYCPPEQAECVERTIDALYAPFNNGVYRTGFARTQLAYEEALKDVFATLDHYEAELSRRRYVCGAALTRADVCFYTTLVRFDPVYHYHFKCNLRRIGDYPNLSNYLRDLYQRPAFRQTTDFQHIKRHYYMSHDALNPSHIVPLGPLVDLESPHDRARFPDTDAR
jgi:putative glutathione S-transferase